MSEAGGRRRQWILAILIIFGLAAAAGIWFGRPLYRHYKEQRSLRMAQEFFSKSDFRSGLLSLRQTLTLNPTNLPALRLMAEFATETQSPAALSWWQRVIDIAPTIENQSLLAAAALRIEAPPFPTAGHAIEALATTAATNVSYHLLASQLALKLNQGAAVETHLLAAVRLEPTNRMHQINLAKLRLLSRQENVAGAARTELAGLTHDPQWGAEVLRVLVADALVQTNGRAARDFSRALLATTNATFVDQLQDLTAAQLAADSDLASKVQELEQNCASNLVMIAQAALWLNQHGQAAETLAWLARLDSKLRELPPLAVIAADALALNRDWSGLEARLISQKWEEQDFFRLAYLARALREQGRGPIATAYWDRAVGAALTRSERSAALVQLAFNWGWREEGVAFLWQLARQGGQAEWPLQNLLRLYSGANDTDGMQRVHEELYRRHPESLPIKNNFAMLSLLLQRDLPGATRLAQEVYQVAGTNGIYASTYALALQLTGHFGEGLKIMQALPETELNRPEVAPYYALLRAANGEKDAVQPLLRRAVQQAALPEEKRLLEGWAN